MPYVYQKNAAGDYVCPHCGVTKERQNTMHYHLKRHEDHLPFQCGVCKKEFLHASVLALHKAARHPPTEREDRASNPSSAGPKTYACPSCKFHTLTRANCIIHYVRRHCNVLALGTNCPTCQKAYNSRTALIYHLGTTECSSALSCTNQELKQLAALKDGTGDKSLTQPAS